MEHYSEEISETVPHVHPGAPGAAGRNRSPQWRRVLQIGVGLGVAAGVAVGATALASAATSGSSGGSSPKSSPAPTLKAPQGRHFFGRGFGGPGIGAFGSVLHGEATVNGPKGYETIEVQTGTVTSLKDVSGSTWSLVVTSADKTALTYTVDSGTSVNGGESGISSVKNGDKVSMVAVVSKGTATAKTLVDSSTLQANGASWGPMGEGPPMVKGPPMGMPVPPASGSSTN